MGVAKPFIILSYRYPYEAKVEYDRTQVPEWADVQDARMKREHPDAEYEYLIQR